MEGMQKTVKFTDGTNQTFTNFQTKGGSDLVTLTGTSAGGWFLTPTGNGSVSVSYLAVSYSTVASGVLYAGQNSIDNGP